MVPAGSEQPSSAPAEFLFPKLNDGGSSLQPPQPELLFDSLCDSQDSRRGAEHGAHPSSLMLADAVWKLFRRIGRGKRWKRDGAVAGVGRRVMFHHGEWKSGAPSGLGIKMAVTRSRGLCSSCGKPRREKEEKEEDERHPSPLPLATL